VDVIGAYLQRGDGSSEGLIYAPIQDGEGFFIIGCRGPSKRLRHCLMDETSFGNMERGAGGGVAILAYSPRVPTDAA
jgi:hypothetical protein